MRLTFLVVLLIALFTIGAWATETQTFTGSSSNGQPFEISFITVRDGNVHVRAQWTPKPNAEYVLNVKRLADPNDTFSYTHACQVYTAQANEPPPGDWDCTFTNVPAGFWTADFRPTPGAKISSMSMTVTAETDE